MHTYQQLFPARGPLSWSKWDLLKLAPITAWIEVSLYVMARLTTWPALKPAAGFEVGRLASWIRWPTLNWKVSWHFGSQQEWFHHVSDPRMQVYTCCSNSTAIWCLIKLTVYLLHCGLLHQNIEHILCTEAEILLEIYAFLHPKSGVLILCC